MNRTDKLSMLIGNIRLNIGNLFENLFDKFKLRVGKLNIKFVRTKIFLMASIDIRVID